MSEVINHDLLCVHCRYNLRGLTSDGDCPECGHPLADSLRGDRLCFADRRWLRRMAWGARLTFFGVLLSMFRVQIRVENLLDALLWTVLLIPAAVLVAGFVLVTSSDPRRAVAEPMLAPRRRARWLGAAVLLLAVASEFVVNRAVPTANPSSSWMIDGIVLLAAIWIWSLSDYGSELARRVPDPGLARQTRICGLGCAGCLFVMTCLGIAATWLLTPYSGGSGFSLNINGRQYESTLAADLIFVPLMIAATIFSIWTLILVFKYYNRIVDAWTLSQTTSAAPYPRQSPPQRASD